MGSFTPTAYKEARTNEAIESDNETAKNGNFVCPIMSSFCIDPDKLSAVFVFKASALVRRDN